MAVSCGWGRDFLVLEKYWPLLVCKAALKLLYNHTSYSYFNNSVNVYLQATIMSSQYPQITQLQKYFYWNIKAIVLGVKQCVSKLYFEPLCGWQKTKEAAGNQETRDVCGYFIEMRKKAFMSKQG